MENIGLFRANGKYLIFKSNRDISIALDYLLPVNIKEITE